MRTSWSWPLFLWGGWGEEGFSPLIISNIYLKHHIHMLRCSWLVENMFYRYDGMFIILTFLNFLFRFWVYIYRFSSQALLLWILGNLRHLRDKLLGVRYSHFPKYRIICPIQVRSLSLPFSSTVSQCASQNPPIFRAKLKPIHKDVLNGFPPSLYFIFENLIQDHTLL